MIDIHNHVLPAVDDGAESLQVSLEMLDAAAAVGIRTIVATPHLDGKADPGYTDIVRRAFDQVVPHARERGIALERGFEIRLAPDIPARLRSGEQITLAGTRVALIDLPFTARPHFADDTLFAVQTSGFLPVLAHPERYPDVQQDPALASALVGRGIALQLNIASLAGTFGRRAQRTAEALLTLGAVHLVATDAHSAGHRMAAVPAGLRRLRDLVGEEGVRRLTIETPATLLNGDELPPPVQALSRGGLRRIFAGAGR